MKATREPCGCKHRDGRWVEFNPGCTEHVNDLHERAQADYRAKHAAAVSSDSVGAKP